jgi:hypothetical protein
MTKINDGPSGGQAGASLKDRQSVWMERSRGDGQDVRHLSEGLTWGRGHALGGGGLGPRCPCSWREVSVVLSSAAPPVVGLAGGKERKGGGEREGRY